MIAVDVKPSGSGWTCIVQVSEAGATTRHTVQVAAADLQRWGQGGDAEDLVRHSFEFLLDREPKESILKSFDLSVISRYFPDYDQAMTQPRGGTK